MNTSSQRSIEICRVSSVKEIVQNIFVLRFRSPRLAAHTLPGQFVNVKVRDEYIPLLRRPFSVYHCDGDSVEIIFDGRGQGTKILSRKATNDTVDVLGPLGVPFGLDDDFSTALLVGGGMGVAPLPMITHNLKKSNKSVRTFLGARTARQIIDHLLENPIIATDDGTKGFKGTVVELLEREMLKEKYQRPKIFACGPNAMLRTLAVLANSLNIPCEVSLECAMACGFGICQGCPVERTRAIQPEDSNQKKYSLVCKEGPVFNIRDVVII